MHILVSGAGFIGSRLIQRLKEDGHQVTGLYRYQAGRVVPAHGVVGDVTDGDILRIVQQVNPQIIIHLAAVAANEQANRFPAEAMLVNAVGTARMVQAAKLLPDLRLFVLASSSEVYGGFTGAVTEDVKLVAENPYAASKMAAEQAVRASGLPFVIARPFNTYGRALIDLPKFVVDEAIVQAVTARRITLRDPNPVRDFLFREDHVSAYVSIVRAFLEGAPLAGETFNFGSGKTVSIGEVAELISGIAGCVAPPAFSKEARPDDIGHLQADSAKAHNLLGWWPEYDLGQGLARAIREWQISRKYAEAESLKASAAWR